VASIRKTKTGWQVQIRKQGHQTLTKSFLYRSDAQTWAKEIESKIERGSFRDPSLLEKTLFRDVLQRYLQEITPQKRSRRSETYCIRGLLRAPLSRLSLAQIGPQAIANYRDLRLRAVSSSTVRRELVTLSHIFTILIREWEYPLPSNPVKMIKKPSETQSRNRRLQADEEHRILEACSGHPNPWLHPLVILAIETAMRRSELLNLRWADIDQHARTALIRESKNGDQRVVPLSNNAIEVLNNLPHSIDGRVIPLLPDSVTRAWTRIAHRLEINDLKFHDLRHEATSRFFEMGLNVMEVSSITGHKDLSMLKRYTHLKAEDLAKKLA